MRHFSFVQQSQRYCKIDTDTNWYVIPESVATDKIQIRLYKQMMDLIADRYNSMIKDGIKPEDARFVLPNACKTDMVFTCNYRAFIEASRLRLCKKAQWEIREVFQRLVDGLKCYEDELSLVTDLCKPMCEFGECPEAKPCKKQLTR